MAGAVSGGGMTLPATRRIAFMLLVALTLYVTLTGGV
jgi:hypothetical protein